MTMTANGSPYGTGAVWHLSLLCPRCGGNMDLENQGRIFVRESTSIVRCQSCRAPQTLLVRLLEIGHEPGIEGEGKLRVATCGTDSGYHRHRSLGEKPVSCQRCLDAHARAEQDRGTR